MCDIDAERAAQRRAGRSPDVHGVGGAARRRDARRRLGLHPSPPPSRADRRGTGARTARLPREAGRADARRRSRDRRGRREDGSRVRDRLSVARDRGAREAPRRAPRPAGRLSLGRQRRPDGGTAVVPRPQGRRGQPARARQPPARPAARRRRRRGLGPGRRVAGAPRAERARRARRHRGRGDGHAPLRERGRRHRPPRVDAAGPARRLLPRRARPVRDVAREARPGVHADGAGRRRADQGDDDRASLRALRDAVPRGRRGRRPLSRSSARRAMHSARSQRRSPASARCSRAGVRSSSPRCSAADRGRAFRRRARLLLRPRGPHAAVECGLPRAPVGRLGGSVADPARLEREHRPALASRAGRARGGVPRREPLPSARVRPARRARAAARRRPCAGPRHGRLDRGDRGRAADVRARRLGGGDPDAVVAVLPAPARRARGAGRRGAAAADGGRLPLRGRRPPRRTDTGDAAPRRLQPEQPDRERDGALRHPPARRHRPAVPARRRLRGLRSRPRPDAAAYASTTT